MRKPAFTGIMESRLRWAVNCASWIPTEQEWLRATACIQSEEKERINKFVFRRDTKLALVGRLLIRSALTQWLRVSNRELTLGRTARGRPILVQPREEEVDFNISHQGRFAVLVAERKGPVTLPQTGWFEVTCVCILPLAVGVDVMQLTRPRGQGTQEFFHTMRRQFTPFEWEKIKVQPTDAHQLGMFYRFWCLKESFIKAEGSGLSYGLQRLEFVPEENWPPTPGCVCEGSKLRVDGREVREWYFEESLIDPEHCIAVAVQHSHPDPPPFSQVSVEEVLSQLTPLRSVDLSDWEHFTTQEDRPS